MSTDYEYELLRTSQEMRQKYVYFLLAAVGASIGFAVTQTKGQQLSSTHIPLALALVCWASSFYLGCMYLAHRATAVSLNGRLIMIGSGKDQKIGKDEEKMAASMNEIAQEFEVCDAKAAFSYRWQLAGFLTGSGFFLAWHVLEMWKEPARLFLTLNP